MEYILIQNFKEDLEYDTLEHFYEEPFDDKYHMVEELNKREHTGFKKIHCIRVIYIRKNCI